MNYENILSQPDPIKNEHPALWPQVISDFELYHSDTAHGQVARMVMDDMASRDLVGRERYKTPLQPFNGRDALQDAYEEALDLSVYLKQALVENKESTYHEDLEGGLSRIYVDSLFQCWAIRHLLLLKELDKRPAKK